MQLTPLKFAALVEEALELHGIQIVEFRRQRLKGSKVVHLTSKKGDQILSTQIDWFLVEQAIYPKSIVNGTALEILDHFSTKLPRLNRIGMRSRKRSPQGFAPVASRALAER